MQVALLMLVAASVSASAAASDADWSLLWRPKLPVNNAASSSPLDQSPPLERFRSLLQHGAYPATRCSSRMAERPGRTGGPPFYFMHMPKAAGSSVQLMLRRDARKSNLTHCLLDQLADWPASSWEGGVHSSRRRKRSRRAPVRGAPCRLDQRTRAAADNITVFYGHAWFNMPRKRWEKRKPVRAVMIRDPVAWAASLYNYARTYTTLTLAMASAPRGSRKRAAWLKHVVRKNRGAASVGRWPTFADAVRFTCSADAKRQEMMKALPRSAVECAVIVGKAAKQACLANERLPRGFYSIVSWWMCGNAECPENLDFVTPTCVREGTPCAEEEEEAAAAQREAQLNTAARNLLNTDIVGTTDSVRGFVRDLERHLDWFNPRRDKRVPHVDPLTRVFTDLGVTKKERRAKFSPPRPNVTQADAACLRRILASDIELYHLARAIVAFRKEKCV